LTFELAPLIERFGYLATFVASVAEGETVLILSGISAHRGYLHLPWVIVVGALGGSVGDFVGFALGHRHGDAVLARFPRLVPSADRVRAVIRAHPDSAVFLVRFMYGFRLVGPLVIGGSGVSWPRFALFNVLSAIVWSACWVLLGYALGEAAQRLLGDVAKYERALFFGALAVAIAVALILHLRRAARER
jgi:membrane protein DedA with SNARE-associated domain